MSFDNAIHAVNQAFETDVRTALDRAEDCPKTEEARALTEARALSRPQSAQADSYLSNGRS